MQGSLRHRLVFLLAAGGLGLCGYTGLQWYELPHYSEDDLKASTELNLRIDLARKKDQSKLTPDQIEEMRRMIRTEVDAEISSRSKEILMWLAIGLALLIMAITQVVFIKLLKSD